MSKRTTIQLLPAICRIDGRRLSPATASPRPVFPGGICPAALFSMGCGGQPSPIGANHPLMAAITLPMAATTPLMAAITLPMAAIPPPMAAPTPPMAAITPLMAATTPPMAAITPTMAAITPLMAATTPLMAACGGNKVVSRGQEESLPAKRNFK